MKSGLLRTAMLLVVSAIRGDLARAADAVMLSAEESREEYTKVVDTVFTPQPRGIPDAVREMYDRFADVSLKARRGELQLHIEAGDSPLCYRAIRLKETGRSGGLPDKALESKESNEGTRTDFDRMDKIDKKSNAGVIKEPRPAK